VSRITRSLVFKITFTILALETLVLVALGWYYVGRFSREIDDGVRTKARIPGTLMAERALNYDAVRDLDAMSRLVGEDVVEGLVLRRDGRVFYSSNPEHEDRPVESVLGPGVASRFSLDMSEPVERSFTSGGRTLLEVVSPLHADGSLIGFLFLVADTSGAEAEKTAIATLFAAGARLCIALTTVSEVLIVHLLIVPRLRRTVSCLQAADLGDLSARIAGAGSEDQIGELQRRVNSMVEEVERRTEERARAVEHARALADQLEDRVEQRTSQLEVANRELEAFAYSVSHDLRAPLRAINGFGQALLEDNEDQLDDAGKGYLRRLRDASARMGILIDELLELSRLTRTDFSCRRVNLAEMARDIVNALGAHEPDRSVELVVPPEVPVDGDPHLLRVALENLLGNAWKFTSRRDRARIELGIDDCGEDVVYFVRDNGVGFDPEYADKIFGAFQRLHAVSEFPGTGIGLATVQRVVHRHSGRIWASGELGKGAIISFTLRCCRE